MRSSSARRTPLAIAAVNEAKRRQKRAIIWTTVGMFGLFWVVVACRDT